MFLAMGAGEMEMEPESIAQIHQPESVPCRSTWVHSRRYYKYPGLASLEGRNLFAKEDTLLRGVQAGDTIS